MCVTQKHGVCRFMSLATVFYSTAEKKRYSGKRNMEGIAPEFLSAFSQIKKRQGQTVPQNVIPSETRPGVSETISGHDDKTSGKSPKSKAAVTIGVSLLLMAVIAMVTVPALSALFVPGNPALTALHVSSDFNTFAGAVTGWVGIWLLDLTASVGIYRYYQKEKPKMAKLTAGLRLLYSAILGMGIARLLQVSASSPALSIYTEIRDFYQFWEIGLITFGFHLIALGAIHEKEGGKKWVNVAIRSLLIMAGIGYVIQYAGMLLATNPLKFAAVVEPVFIIPMVLGELAFAIRMLIRGGKRKNWAK